MVIERGKHTYGEIMSQGEVWKATLDAFQSQAAAVQAVLQKPIAQTLFTGCGSTYYLSRSAAAAWQALTGRLGRAVPASELWLLPQTVLTSEEALLIAVSRSAETTETLRAVEVFKSRAGENVLAVTVYGDRELGQRSAYRLVTQGAEEESVAQTRSFTSMYLLTLAASGLAAGQTDMVPMLYQAAQAFQPLVGRHETIARQLAEDTRLESFVFLGSGANYGLACEAMLKMKEMSLSPSEAFHFLEFRHGPKSVVTPGTLIVGLLGDTARNEEIKVLEDMQALGAKVLAVSETGEGLRSDYTVTLDSGLPELPRAPLLLPVLQLLAFYRACAKGLDPDRPTNLEAVVRL